MSVRELIKIMPVRVDDHVEMVGTTSDGTPDLGDFAGYDPSADDVMTVWMSEHDDRQPETPEESLSYSSLFEVTREYHDQMAGFGRSAIHASCHEAGAHLPCDYSDPPVYELGDGTKALTRAIIYRATGDIVLTRPLVDLGELASIDPALTGYDVDPVQDDRRYFGETKGGSGE